MYRDSKFSGQQSKGKTRAEQESKEPVETVSVDAPEERFQTSAQVNNTDVASKTTVPDSGFVPKSTGYKGSSLKQEVAARVIKDAKGVGGATPDVSSAESFGLRAIEFSGDAGSILGSTSGTPIMDKNTQGGTRVEKRLSDTNKQIDYLASEQVVVEYDNIPSLSQAPDTTVGYNGNPKNINARMQKKTGATSAEILYDRSLDFIAKDQFVFAMGQVVKEDDNDAAYPTHTYECVTDDDTTSYQSVEFTRVRGNYAPRYINVTFKKDSATTPAYVSAFSIDEDDFSINAETPESVNRSASNHYIDLNAAELARQTIDQNAGAPTSEHYNPLGRSVDQPSRTVMYLRDMEASTAATIFASYKFAQKARGHYLNRTAKDGQDLVGPAFDALYGHLMADNSSTSITTKLQADTANFLNNNPFFNRAGMRAGSAALIPAIFDSPRKYNTKADFVTQPRGLRLPLQTADNNLDPFRCKKEFIQALNSVDVYSTIDRGYDPMSTVEVTDNVRLVYPYSWKDTLGFTKTAWDADREYQSHVFRYKYGAGSGSNVYYITVGDPVLNGVAWFFEQHVSSIFNALSSTSTGAVTLKIPVIHSTMHFSLWDLLVCASLPYIIYERTNSMKDILDYEQFYKYPFPEFVSIKEANPMNAVNYGNPSALQPLVVKQMMPSSACRWTMPELFYRVGEEDVMMPFYFSENCFVKGGTDGAPTLTVSDHEEFNTPVIRSGVRLAYADDFFAMSVKDQMLCRDILTRLPGVLTDSTVNGYVYKYSQDAEGIPVLSSPDLTAQKIHSTPRQMGWFMDAFAGECCVYANDDSSNFGSIKASSVVDVIKDGPSFRVIAYRAIPNSKFDPYAHQSTLGPAAVNVGRAQSFTQVWNMRRASSNNSGRKATEDFDIDISLYDGFSNLTGEGVAVGVSDHTIFKPYIFAKYSGVNSGTHKATNIYSNGPLLFSLHRILWALLQKMPFVINPFDCSTDLGFIDPFCYAYMFNLAGFMSASYHEEVYNRASEKQNLGYGYVKDPFLAASPVFKDASRYTEV